jgi:tagatose 6-phosphate kinase
MIITVTPNVALDLTYHLDALRLGEVNRVTAVAERAGGKGVNVARVLAAHGVPVRAFGFCGGATGERVRALLSGVDHAFTSIAEETRRTVVLADGATATGFWEPGPMVSQSDWRRLSRRVTAELLAAKVLVLSGSLPPGSPEDGYAQLIRAAHAAGVPVILDADGGPLRYGLAAGPTVVKPNAAELASLAGRPIDSVAAAVEAAQELGAVAVVVSLGDKGLVAVTAAGRWHAAPSQRFAGNGTGAGDAAVAALAFGLAEAEPWPARLRLAVAWSAAAAAAPTAGDIAAGVVDADAVTVRDV